MIAPPQRFSKTEGFTLVELLVALVIFAVMISAVFALYNSVTKAQGVVKERSEELMALQRSWILLAQDINQTVVRLVQKQNEKKSAEEQNQEITPLFLGNQGKNLFVLTKIGWSNPLRLKRPDIQRVWYQMHNQDLWRFYLSDVDPNIKKKPIKQLVMQGVRHIRCRFLNSKGNWQDNWRAFSRNQGRTVFSNDGATKKYVLPRAVEISVEVAHLGMVKRIFLVETGRWPGIIVNSTAK